MTKGKEEKKFVRLSASRIKTLQTCSWTYWCKYILKLPDTTNDGAQRGNVVHKFLEVLLNSEKHIKTFNLIRSKGIEASNSAIRFVNILAKRYSVTSEENLEQIRAMIEVALTLDFYCKGCKELKGESRFDLKNEDPAYEITGFIDKIAIFPKGRAKICDYKSSKVKFPKKELASNVQAMMYSLVAKKIHKMKDVKVEFHFLKFPKSPIQEATFTQEQLDGFEIYLNYLNDFLSDYNESNALADLAVKSYSKKWLCGSPDPKKWSCPFRRPFEYFALLDAKGGVKKASFKANLKPDSLKGEMIVKKEYSGCPHYNKKQIDASLEDFI